MKFIFLLVLILSNQVSANLWVESDLSLTTSYDLDAYTEHKKIVKKGCNVGGGSTEYGARQQLSASSGNGSQIFDSTRTEFYGVNATFPKGRSIRLRSSEVRVGITSTNSGTSASAEFRDNFDASNPTVVDVHEPDGGCDKDVWTLKPTTQKVSGAITFKYRVPKNTWAVRLKRKEMSGKFSVNNVTNVENNLVRTRESTNELAEKQTLVWAQPGSIISFSFNYGAADAQTELTGRVEVEFEPIFLTATAKELGQYKGDLEKLLRDLRENPNTEFQNKAFEIGLKFASNPVELLKAAETDTLAINSAARSLYSIASLPSSGEMAINGKIAASLGMFASAFQLVNAISPYCKPMRLDLLLTNRSVTVPGYIFASFYLVRSSQILKSYYKATGEFSPGGQPFGLEAFISEFNYLAKAGKTYGEVAKDKVLRKKMGDSLRLFYSGLGARGNAEFGLSMVETDLSFVAKTFPEISGEQYLEKSVQKLKVQAEKYFQLIERFNLISIDPLLDTSRYNEKYKMEPSIEELTEVRKGLDEIGDEVSANILVKLENGGDANGGLISFIARLFNYNLNLFSHELEESAHIFENLRKTYVAWISTDFVTTSNENILGCVPVTLGGEK